MTVSSALPSPSTIDSSTLEGLVGYNTRRASLVIMEAVVGHLAQYDLRIVDFSILSLVAHNPGATSRQVSASLDILPPNLVGMLNAIEKRGLMERKPHPMDGRALGLHLTAAGEALAAQAECSVEQLEIEATSRLSTTERKTLIRLLQKIYRS